MLFFSLGDIIDKYTILLIKKSKNLDVDNELEEFEKEKLFSLGQLLTNGSEIFSYFRQLLRINKIQWEFEDQISNCMDRKDIGNLFLKIKAQNKLRVETKNKINELDGESFIEKKHYKNLNI
jgi:hypothetical protein